MDQLYAGIKLIPKHIVLFTDCFLKIGGAIVEQGKVYNDRRRAYHVFKTSLLFLIVLLWYKDKWFLTHLPCRNNTDHMNEQDTYKIVMSQKALCRIKENPLTYCVRLSASFVNFILCKSHSRRYWGANNAPLELWSFK